MLINLELSGTVSGGFSESIINQTALKRIKISMLLQGIKPGPSRLESQHATHCAKKTNQFSDYFHLHTRTLPIQIQGLQWLFHLT
jgi:hypothetical protein